MRCVVPDHVVADDAGALPVGVPELCHTVLGAKLLATPVLLDDVLERHLVVRTPRTRVVDYFLGSARATTDFPAIGRGRMARVSAVLLQIRTAARRRLAVIGHNGRSALASGRPRRSPMQGRRELQGRDKQVSGKYSRTP